MFDAEVEDVDLDAALFPVVMRPVFVAPAHPMNSPIPLPRHAAVVDEERNHVFAVVTDGYRLVTNGEALGLASEIMKRVFSIIEIGDMRCFNLTMPKSRSFCHIDLVHTKSTFEPWDRDKWSPFLRVTNSYNRTRKLRFEIGFCRWICKNGMIFGANSIEISDAHSHAGLDRIRYDRLEHTLGNIKALEALFTGQLHHLKRYYVPPSMMPGLFCKVFGVTVPDELDKKPQRGEQLLRIARKLDDLTEEYFGSMGHHAYAALNVLTDYATRPTGVLSASSVMHGYQLDAAQWMTDFLDQIEEKSFDFEKYLGDWTSEGLKLMALLTLREASELSIPRTR